MASASLRSGNVCGDPGTGVWNISIADDTTDSRGKLTYPLLTFAVKMGGLNVDTPLSRFDQDNYEKTNLFTPISTMRLSQGPSSLVATIHSDFQSDTVTFVQNGTTFQDRVTPKVQEASANLERISC